MINGKNEKNNLKLMLADFCYFNRNTFGSRYTPLNIGLLAQYANQEFGKNISISLYKSVDKFLNQAKENPPDIVGLAVYFWNTALNQYVVKCLREMFGEKIVIVLGGPSIDSDKLEQYKFLTEKFPGANAVVVNEGELGFGNIIKKTFSDRKNLFKDHINGVSFVRDNQLIQGSFTGLNLDLATLGSPYLSGLMDEFMHSEYQPLIQTSRFCPYTCAFCVSGKNRGKLRGYPIEQVKEELKYVSKKYADRPHHQLRIADENFGILKRDVEIAEAIVQCKKDYGFPKIVNFYNDKRFTETSRAVINLLGNMTTAGLKLSLQTDNPETLKAINRRNVTKEEIDDALAWASNLGIPATTELIFGLPYETRDGFIDSLNAAIDQGFDNIKPNHLFIMDGIELNRPSHREKFKIKTKYRTLGQNYTKHDGHFIAEYEEVVVSTDTFSYEDFLDVRSINFLFFAVFTLDFQTWFFQFIRSEKISLSNFFLKFIKPNRNINWPKGYLRFLDDFKTSVEDELHNSREETLVEAKKIYESNNNDVGEPTQINTRFGARLIYQEYEWVKPVLLQHFTEMMKEKLSEEDKNLANSLISLAESERVDLRNVSKRKPLDFSFDAINWKKNKFKKHIRDYKMPSKKIIFSLDDTKLSLINGLKKHTNDYGDRDIYYQAVSTRDAPILLYNLAYEDKKNHINL